MENIENTTETSTILNTDLGVVLEDSASSLTKGVIGLATEGLVKGFRS